MSEREQTDNMPDERPIEELELDLLVDGELEEPRRRELLARLEAAPQGWRRCAMAFLEAQCWRQSFGKAPIEAEPASPAAQPTPPSPAVREPNRTTRRHRHLRVAGAMAASFLVALFGVWYLRGGGDSGSSKLPPMRDGISDVATSQGDAPKAPSPFPDQPVAPVPASEPWQVVNVSGHKAEGGTTDFQIPAVERDRFDRADVDRLSSGTPIHFVKSLEDSGHRVERSRSYIPVRLKDGRQMVVPVDDYDVQRDYPRFQ